MAVATLVVSVGPGCRPPPSSEPVSTSPVTSDDAPFGRSAEAPRAVAVSERREATIHFEQRDGKPFPYPLVHARVRGVETRLILDTGASHTVLDVWLLEQLGVELVPSGQPGEGHAGEAVTTSRARAPHLTIAGWGEVPGDALAVRLPSLFRALGLGGVVSPQSLATDDTAVILDLPESSLRRVPRDEARRDPAVSLGSADLCHVGDESDGVVYVVDAVVEGLPARLVVDSGAARTDVLAESVAGQRLRARASRGDPSYTVSGRVHGQRVDDVTLTVGQVVTTLDLGLMSGRPSGACPRDGHLGLDVLMGCALVLTPDDFGARCGGTARRQ